MRALWSAVVIRSLNTSSAWLSSSAEKASFHQASRTWAWARARSPWARSARASAKRPLAVSGGSLAKKARAVEGSPFSCHSIASARRRKKVMLGQLGLAAMKAA